MASYNFNKGVDSEVEFKGLRSQYLFIFAGGIIAVFILFVVMYLMGVDTLVCIITGVTGAGVLVYYTFSLNAKYGSHGLMKLAATKKHPRRIVNRRRIGRMLRISDTFNESTQSH